ncbi:MAG: glycosyltransferase family A protein [Candidatus Buchananbacteria bacterium]|jgi:glycosyltransferase involved in cell wall biosynthesis
MISVIIPAYNAEKTIQKCLDSIFNQTYRDIEVIVVDDGSTDDMLLALTNCKKKITIISQENKGAPAARNYGFKFSQGEYVIFLDADIVMKPAMLEKMILALKSDESVSFAYSSFWLGWKKFKLWPYDAQKLKQMPYIHTSSLIKRNAFPGFDESLKKFQDWDLFLMIAEKGGKGIFIPEILFEIKARGTMSSWFPKMLFKFPFKPKSVEDQIAKYQRGMEIIRKKHGI